MSEPLSVVIVHGTRTYDMFDVIELDTEHVTLATPLVLERGESIALRLRRAQKTVDVTAVVADLSLAGGGKGPAMTLRFAASDAARLAPLVG
jgi:hypothetical protein